jgi:hypothetical protein
MSTLIYISKVANVWFSGVPDKDKDKENNTVAMYLYFIK